ncbi:alpha/beta fold hydrolase [Streptomyces sp. NPDC058373]|uniref:alpha/beta fold hydrolase n=1 Tax=unclassified Streptomyces TaxID=2593676 RepID=UPI00365D529B
MGVAATIACLLSKRPGRGGRACAAGVFGARTRGCGRGVPERQGWRTTPSTYVVCARDRAIDPETQRRMAARCTEVREWPVGHSPFVGRPELVVGLVREVLAGLGEGAAPS